MYVASCNIAVVLVATSDCVFNVYNETIIKVIKFSFIKYNMATHVSITYGTNGYHI